jgi:hypothetical protein
MLGGGIMKIPAIDLNPAVADLILSRINVNSTQEMKKLNLSKTGGLIEKVIRLKKEVKPLSTILVDELFLLIPEVEDKSLRNSLIKLKRDLHNERQIKLSEQKITSMRLTFTDSQSEIFQRWLETNNELINTEEALKETYAHEVKIAERKLKEAFNDTPENELFRGLSMVNPSLVDTILRKKEKKWNLDSNITKSTYSYLQRATFKTSPLSTLTQLACTGLINNNDCIFNQEPRTNLRWSRALITSFFEYISKDFRFNYLIKFNLSTEVNFDGKSRRIRGVYYNQGGFSWKKEEIVSNNMLVGILARLDKKFEAPFLIRDLEKALDVPNKSIIVKLLLSQRLVRPIVPFSSSVDDPFNKIADLIAERGHDDDHILIRELRRLETLRYQLISELKPSIRLHIMNEIRAAFLSIHEICPFVSSDRLNDTLLYEDVRSKYSLPYLGEYIREDMYSLQKYIEPYAFVTNFYSQLIDWFIDRVGEGEKCDLLTFLSELASKENILSKMVSSARNYDMNPLNPKIKCTEPLTYNIFFQIAAKSYSDIIDGNYQLVVNKISNGRGTIFSRFTKLFTPENYRNQLEEWLSQTFEGKPVEFSVSTDWSNLQENFSTLSNFIRWIEDLDYTDSGIKHRLKDFEVVHDPIHNSLKILNDSGDVVSPVYTGTVPEHMTSGINKIFMTMANPWIINTPFGINPRPFQTEFNGSKLHIAREEDGRIVLNREKWLFPNNDFKEILSASEKIDLMYKVREFFKLNHLPNEVFAIVSDENGYLLGKKPFYLNIDNIYSINMLIKSISNCKYVMFTEMHPDQEHSWFQNDAGEPLVTEFVSLGSIKFD